MEFEYKKLGELIELSEKKNKDLSVTNLVGMNIEKKFIPSIANTVGTNLANYKLVNKNQFACNLMHIGRDEAIVVSLYLEDSPSIISPAYKIFQIKDTNIIKPEFLMLYFLRPAFDQLCWFYTDSSIRGSLDWSQFCEIEVPIPPIEIQEKIINIYEFLNNRIELKNNISKNLDDIIKSTYKYYFEDYEPFHNQQFYESEMGKIPEGWIVKPLEEFINFQEGPGIRKWQYVENDGIKFLNIRCIQDNDLILDKANMISQEESSGKYAHFMLNEWDIVVSTSGTLGRYAIVRKEHLPLCLNTSIIRFVPKHSFNHYSYIYSYLTSEMFYDHLMTMSTGSAQLNFGPTHLKQIKLIVPSEEVLLRYHDLIFPFIERIVSIKKEINTLIELRDILISKLMSGEIDVEKINWDLND